MATMRAICAFLLAFLAVAVCDVGNEWQSVMSADQELTGVNEAATEVTHSSACSWRA
jgi:hypothetical protein